VGKKAPDFQLADHRGNPFQFLRDPENKIAKSFGCSSKFMLGTTSRAVSIVNQKGIILYHYVEPTVLTRRGSTELLQVISQLKKNHLLETPGRSWANQKSMAK